MDEWMERWMEAGCLTQGQWRGMKIVRPREREKNNRGEDMEAEKYWA